MAFAAIAQRFGKTPEELDEEPWSLVAPLLEVLEFEQAAEGD